MTKEGWIKRKANGNGIPWNKGLTKDDDDRIAQPWLGKKRPEVKNWLTTKGKKASPELKEKLSKIAKEKGFGKWMVGKKASAETKSKLKEIARIRREANDIIKAEKAILTKKEKLELKLLKRAESKEKNTVIYTCEDCGVVKECTIWNFKKRHADAVRCTSCQTKVNNAKRKAEDRYTHSEESRKNMSAALKGRASWNKGKKMTKPPWNKGKKMKDVCPNYVHHYQGKNLVDPVYRDLRNKVHDCCANMVGRIMRIKNEKKVYKTFDYLGYTKTDFINHIESKFKEGMTWDNWGEWHVDHSKPVSAFVKEGITDVREINALCNLQPLWKAENLKKSCKYTPETICI